MTCRALYQQSAGQSGPYCLQACMTTSKGYNTPSSEITKQTCTMHQVSIHTHTHMHLHAHTNTQSHAHTCTSQHTHTHALAYSHTQLHTHAQVSTCTNKHSCTHIPTHGCALHVHTCKHTHAHVSTHSPPPLPLLMHTPGAKLIVTTTSFRAAVLSARVATYGLNTGWGGGAPS